MLFFLMACACSDPAIADGAPPFSDGLPSDAIEEPADDLGTVAEPIEEPSEAPSIVALDRAAVEDHEAPSPLELLDADVEPVGAPPRLTIEDRGPYIQIDPSLTRMPLPPHPWIRLADEIIAGLSVLGSAAFGLLMFVRKVWPVMIEIRDGLRETLKTPAPAPEPAPVDLAQLTTLAGEHARLKAEREIVDAERQRLSDAVEAQTKEIQRLKQASTERLAAQSSVSDEIEASRSRTRDWLVR